MGAGIHYRTMRLTNCGCVFKKVKKKAKIAKEFGIGRGTLYNYLREESKITFWNFNEELLITMA